MLKEARRRALALHRHDEGLEGEPDPHVIAHRPADHLARGEVEGGGEIEPALACWNVGQVAEPNAVLRRCLETLGQKVRRDRQMMAAAMVWFEENGVIALCGAKADRHMVLPWANSTRWRRLGLPPQ